VHFVLLTIAQENWKLKLDKEGIKIYARPSVDSKIKALKVLCTADASLSEMAAVLLDISSQDEWFYHTKSTVLLKISATELYYYAELDFPFPFSNRDFVEHLKLTQNPLTQTLTMTVDNLPGYLPVKKDKVRVLQSNCGWVISPIGKHTIRIEFTLFADPAGSIPAWLINMFSVYGPLETFKKLKIQLTKPQYKNISLPFIKD
jgi:START domain